jgi:hypothetical protein
MLSSLISSNSAGQGVSSAFKTAAFADQSSKYLQPSLGDKAYWNPDEDGIDDLLTVNTKRHRM